MLKCINIAIFPPVLYFNLYSNWTSQAKNKQTILQN